MNKRKGWKRPDARRYMVAIRVHKDERKALEKLAKRKRMTVSELVRWFLYREFPPLKW